MANEFIARNGLIALDNSRITGSLNISGSLSVNNTPAVLGSGTTNRILKLTASSTAGDSLIFDNGTNVLIGTTTTPTPVVGVAFPLTVTSANTTRIRIDSTQATPNSGFGLYANSVQKWSIAMFGATSDFTIYNDALLASAILVKGGSSNVLVGTTTDAGFKLDVNGTLRATGAATFSSSVTGSGINAKGTTLNNSNAIRFFRADNTEMGYIGWSDENTNNSTWLFKSSNGNPIAFSPNGTNQSVIFNTDGSAFFNYPSLAVRSFVFRTISGRPLTLETVALGGVHSFYLRPNDSGRHLISSNYLSGGVYLPLSLSGRENDADLVLTTSGNILIGKTTDDGRGKLQVSFAKTQEVASFYNTNNASSGDFAIVTGLGANADNTNSYHYIAGTGLADRFYVYGNGTFATVSDQRLKKNISTVKEKYLENVLSLNVVNYNWKDQPDNHSLELGLIAQQVENLFPFIIHENRPDLFGNVYKSVQVSALPYILIKAIQEQQTQIESLKSTLQHNNIL